MKAFHSIEKLIDTAVRCGHNRKEVEGIISQNYDYIKRVYPTASARQAVHIAFVIYK